MSGRSGVPAVPYLRGVVASSRGGDALVRPRLQVPYVTDAPRAVVPLSVETTMGEPGVSAARAETASGVAPQRTARPPLPESTPTAASAAFEGRPLRSPDPAPRSGWSTAASPAFAEPPADRDSRDSRDTVDPTWSWFIDRPLGRLAPPADEQLPTEAPARSLREAAPSPASAPAAPKEPITPAQPALAPSHAVQTPDSDRSRTAALMADRPRLAPAIVPSTTDIRPRSEPEASAAAHLSPPASDRVGTSPAPVAAPTVHVTIGRVEIRASLPEAAPVRRRPEAPRGVMSLDDYIDQRRRSAR